MEEQIIDLKQDKKGLEKTIDELKKEKENFIEEIKFLTNKVTECQEEHESTKQNLNHQTLLNLEECERIRKYKKLIDTTIIKMADFKQQITNLKHCNNELFLQNKKLNVRAAAGFVNLTPRPDYSKMKINIEKKSTVQMVEELLLQIASDEGSASEKKKNRKSPKKSKEPESKKSIEEIPANENKPIIKQLVILKRSRSLSARPRRDIDDFVQLESRKDNLDILRASKTIGNSSFLPLKNDTNAGSLNQSLCNDIYEDNLNLANKMLNKLIAGKKGF